MKIASGHTTEEMEAQKKERYQKLVTGHCNELIYLQPDKWMVPRHYLKFQEKVYNFKYKPEDVVVMTYSKSGTTWMQEIIWTMLNNPNLDNPKAEKSLFVRAPWVEMDMLMGKPDPDSEMSKKMMMAFKQLVPNGNAADGFMVQIAGALPGRRTIKTHFPLSLHNPELLSTAKIIFVARNPKDTVLSFLHHHRFMKAQNFVGTQDEFIDYFVDGDLIFGPFAPIIKEAWAKKDHPNMHFLFYEDMKADIDGELKKINQFIGTGLSDGQLKNVKEYTSFNQMKARDAFGVDKDQGKSFNKDVVAKEGGFFRKGTSGGWKEKLTPEQNAKIDAYIKKEFDGTGLNFKY